MASTRVLVFAGVFIAALAVALSLYLPTPNTGDSMPARPNVLIISIDTLRADHLGYFGYPADTSPFLDFLARENVVYTNMYSSSTLTIPSHASMFTSRYPHQHEAYTNFNRLSDGVYSMPDMFAGLNYTTNAFVSVLMMAQLKKGFGGFVAPQKGFVIGKDRAYMHADTMTNMTVDWLRGRNDTRPFFLFLHYYDVHELDDYPPLVQTEPYKKPGEGRMMDFWVQNRSSDFSRNKGIIWRTKRYDHAISFVDSQVERLFTHLKAANLTENTLIVVTSDHGEGLEDHNISGHGPHLYDEAIHVPLIMVFPGGKKRLVVDDMVSHVDLLPTLADYLGADLDANTAPMGLSLMPLMGGAKLGRNYVYSETSPNEVIVGGQLITSFLRQDDTVLYSLRGKQHKYIYRSDSDDEFYDMSSDPKERKNLFGSGMAEEDAMAQLMAVLLAAVDVNSTPQSSHTIDPQVYENLKSLGYVG